MQPPERSPASKNGAEPATTAFDDFLSQLEQRAEQAVRAAEGRPSVGDAPTHAPPRPIPPAVPESRTVESPVPLPSATGQVPPATSRMPSRGFEERDDREADDEDRPIDEEARRRFEADWNCNRPQPLASYLPEELDPLYETTLEELVLIDLEYGWKLRSADRQTPTRYSVSYYRAQFPRLTRRAVLLRLLEQEYRVRHRDGDAPAPQAFAAEYPDLLTVPIIAGWSVAERRRRDNAALAAGRQLGPFRLQHALGRGGMGEVWKAWDTVGERFVVIKFVPPELRRFPEELARVKHTFKQVHALQHEHICPTYLLGEDPEAGTYLVMKFLDGVTLSTYRALFIQQRGTLPLAEVTRLLRPVAAALDYAHAQKIVHRDIKPQNIMCSREGTNVQVVDFGLVAEFRTSVTRISQVKMDTSGTYPYMAPEQWRGQYQDAATDQYALGVVLYEMLSGRVPFEAVDESVLRHCVLQEPVSPLPEQSSAVNRVLARALAKDRGARFPSCTAVIETLGALA